MRGRFDNLMKEFSDMSRSVILYGLAAAILALPACTETDDGNRAGNAATGEATGEVSTTIASGIAQDSQFLAAAKSAGLDATLAGPGPYTVLAPSNAAFAKLPAGTLEGLQAPEKKGELTALLTYHILPGVVLAEDIGKAIDNAKGKAVLATMGGETVTATKEGDKIVLTDSTGAKATVVTADQKRSNGIVHEIDTVLSPPKSG
ncbi:MAG TPA: fasciclin domain-containing protein [Sphingomicrobium sp.]|nr:fasciclin domain-containing protein [Sphingomicrobium sp.]